jgi:hypothetical protein
VFFLFYGVHLQGLSAQLTACLRDLTRHLKTEPTDTVAFCFGTPENTVSSSQYVVVVTELALLAPLQPITILFGVVLVRSAPTRPRSTS